MPNTDGSFDPLFRWLESTAFNDWMAESASLVAYPGILAAHTVGLGLLVGLNVAMDLRLLGVARSIPPAAFIRFQGVMRFGLWINVITGIALVLTFPTKALTNPVFYLKLGLIAVALLMLQEILRRTRGGDSESRGTKLLVLGSLVTWLGAITAGRLLAYTCRRVLVDLGCR